MGSKWWDWALSITIIFAAVFAAIIFALAFAVHLLKELIGWVWKVIKNAV